MIRSCFFLLLLLLPAAAQAAAACVIKHQQLLLLVQDRVSSRYSLSGGYTDAGETPAQAALRELFEETGLRGKITAELGQWHDTTLFACQTQAPIQAQTGSGFVSLLHAPDLGGEILNARLIDPTRLPAELRRFPAQLDWLTSRLSGVTDSPVRWLPDFSAEDSPLHRAELPLIQRLQAGLGPDAPWLLAFNLLGVAPVQLALALVLLPLLGWARLSRLLFAMVLLTLLVQLLKEGLAWPRPFHLQPDLARQAAQGFGMPSGHAASTLLLWGMLLRWIPGLRARHALSLALVLALLTGMARIWLGVHFISDVVAGLGLGGLLLALRPHLYALADKQLSWWCLNLICLISAWLTQSSALAMLGLFTLGLVSGRPLPFARVPDPAIGSTLLALTGAGVIGGLALAMPIITDSTLSILLGQGLLCVCLGLWLSAGLWWLLTLINPGPAAQGPTSLKRTL